MRNPMGAGRELDALVAEKVMGWVWRRWPVKHGPTPALKLLWQIDAASYSNDGLGITLPLLGDEVPADDAVCVCFTQHLQSQRLTEATQPLTNQRFEV